MGCCLGTESVEMPVQHIAPLTPDASEEEKSGKLLIRTETFVHQFDGRLEAKYRLGRLLGSGAYGKVFEAVHLPSGTKRAVKIIDRDLTPESLFGNMISEVEILRSLVRATQDHPHIIKVYEVIVESDYINVVCELCTGGELFKKIVAMKQFREEVVADYMQQILSAVAYCHDRHLVHRDIKPENFVFESTASNAMLKIVDFGMCMKLCTEGNSARALGTRYYLAPEAKSGRYDEKCDLWSCGVILYMLFTGQTPQPLGADFASDKMRTGKLEFTEPKWNKVSDLAKDFLTNILALDPKQRLSARELLEHPWLEFVTKSKEEGSHSECQIMQRLKDFSSVKLKQAALTYIAAQFTSMHETEKLRRKFMEMDVNKDGQLSRDELQKGFEALGLSSEFDVDKIMEVCDSNRSGFIDYTEFITAAMNWQQALCDSQIEAAFAAFDEDHNGRIEMKEIKKVFAASKIDDNDPIWSSILSEMDVNGDGVIDLQEFKLMMKRTTA